MIIRLLLPAILLSVIGISSIAYAEVSVRASAESPGEIPLQAAELPYPPIRLELAEASLTPPLLGAKDELIQGSQVFEDAIHRSGAVFQDAQLEKLLNEALPLEAMGEKAKGFHFRIYILKDPTLNAMTTPTGSIYINSGLLAAMENTDQIRLVLAHEAHHIIDQDIVHQYKKMKDEVGAIRILQLIATPAVAVAIGESDMETGRIIANVYTSANLAVSISYQLAFLGYGRGNETECDLFAMQIFNSHRYDLRNAQRVFQLFEDEHKKFGKGFQSHYFSDHETGKQRAERVEQFMKEVAYQAPAGSTATDMDYHRLTHEIRIENARLNTQLRRPWHAIEDLEELSALFPQDARIPLQLGRAYAAIAADPKILKEEVSSKTWKEMKIKDEKAQSKIWAGTAETYFQSSLALDPSLAEAHRELGLLNEAQDKQDAALAGLHKYLELRPSAKDFRYIKSRTEKIRNRIEAQTAANTQEAKKS